MPIRVQRGLLCRAPFRGPPLESAPALPHVPTKLAPSSERTNTPLPARRCRRSTPKLSFLPSTEPWNLPGNFPRRFPPPCPGLLHLHGTPERCSGSGRRPSAGSRPAERTTDAKTEMVMNALSSWKPPCCLKWCPPSGRHRGAARSPHAPYPDAWIRPWAHVLLLPFSRGP